MSSQTGNKKAARASCEQGLFQQKDFRKIFLFLQNSVACSKWKLLGRQLDLSEAEIETIAANNPLDVNEQCFQMFRRWEQSKSQQASPCDIIVALRHLKLDKVADELSAYLGLQTAEEYPACRVHRSARDMDRMIKKELQDWYRLRLSKLHPIPWCDWVEKDLDHIFTNLEIVKGRKHQTLNRYSDVFRTEQSLAELLWSSNDRTISFIEGAAGIGKSCLCRRLALTWANDRQIVLPGKFTLVFLLEARTLTGSLSECIAHQLLPEDFGLSCNEIKSYLKECQEKCLFIIDGVDELPVDGKTMLHNITSGRCLRHANVLLTGRPESTEEFIKHVDIHLRITGFTWENTKIYISKYFNQHQCEAEKNLLHRLERDGKLQELSRTPFTTLLFCLLAEESPDNIPSHRCGIIKEIINTTTQRYVSSLRKTSAIDSADEITTEEILTAASQVAYTGAKSETVVFRETELKAVCGEGIYEHLLRSGLFNRDFILSRLHTKGCCYFPHKSIQDFLCARYLASLSADNLTATMEECVMFRHNRDLCEMLLTMTCGQPDMYIPVVRFYSSQTSKVECLRQVVETSVTVTDSNVLDEIADILRTVTASGEQPFMWYTRGAGQLFNLTLHGMGLPPTIVIHGVPMRHTLGHRPTNLNLHIDTKPLTNDLAIDEVITVPVYNAIPLGLSLWERRGLERLTLPWVVSADLHKAITLVKGARNIHVLCVCVTPTAKSVNDLSNLIDSVGLTQLIILVSKPKDMWRCDDVFLKLLAVCKIQHNNVRVESCVSRVHSEMSVLSNGYLKLYCKLPMSPLQVYHQRCCPF